TVRVWVDVLLPREERLSGRTLQCRVEVTYTYPGRINKDGFTLQKKTANRQIQFVLAPAGAGRLSKGLWTAGIYLGGVRGGGVGRGGVGGGGGWGRGPGGPGGSAAPSGVSPPTRMGVGEEGGGGGIFTAQRESGPGSPDRGPGSPPRRKRWGYKAKPRKRG